MVLFITQSSKWNFIYLKSYVDMKAFILKILKKMQPSKSCLKLQKLRLQNTFEITKNSQLCISSVIVNILTKFEMNFFRIALMKNNQFPHYFLPQDPC